MDRLLELRSKSHKGKNRLKEHGRLWVIVRELDLAFLIRPAGDNPHQYFRWLHKQNDQHFNWEEVQQ